MLDSVKSVLYCTAIGTAAGAAVGGAGGVAISRDACLLLMFPELFSPILTGKSVGRALRAFKSCKITFPIGSAMVLGVAGGALGFTYGVSKEIWKSYKIHKVS